MKWEYQTVKLNMVGTTWGVSFDTDEAQNFTNQLGAEVGSLFQHSPSTKALDIQRKWYLFLKGF